MALERAELQSADGAAEDGMCPLIVRIALRMEDRSTMVHRILSLSLENEVQCVRIEVPVSPLPP